MPWGSEILVTPQNESYLTGKQIIWTIKKADMITCDAEHVKKEIIKLSGYSENKIIVFPQGIDLKKFNPRANGSKIRNKLGWQNSKILIMTRSFKSIYGIEYFLRTIPNIIKENPETRIILCGDGPLENSFKSFVSENKLTDYVYFAGFVKNEELPTYYAASDIYVSTSLSDGTSNSLLEAMACGLPVVVTDLPAIKEWAKDGYNGLLVPPKDSHQVYEKINLLLNDDDLIKKFGRRSYEIAKNKADWDKNFKKLEKIYDKLLEGNI